MERIDLKLGWLNYVARLNPIESRLSQTPMQRLVNWVDKYFIPIVMLVTIGTSLLWWLLTGKLSMATSAGLSVLIVACPHALRLSIPIAGSLSIRMGAKHGILIKNRQSLALLQRVKKIVFDRASLLVADKKIVTDFIPVVDNYNGTDLDILQLAASLASYSEQALASAIVDRAIMQKLTLKVVDKFHSEIDCGIQGIIDGKIVRVGSISWLATQQIATVLQIANCQILYTYQQQWEAVGKQVVWIAIDREIAGIFSISDAIKPTAAVTIANLKKLGLQVSLLTEDNLDCASRIADEIGIDRVFAQIEPSENIEIIRTLQSTSTDKHRSIVAMVGSDKNTDPLLAQADVGISLGTIMGATNSDIRIVCADLRAIVAAIDLYRSTLTKIERKLLLVFIFNLLWMPLVAGIFYLLFSRSLLPELAIFAIMVSSILVWLGSWRRLK